MPLPNYIPNGGQGHILLTTCSTATGSEITGIEVGKLSIDDSKLLLLRRSKKIEEETDTEQTAAEELAKELDGLPLALDSAGALIEETEDSLQYYLDEYRKIRANIFEEYEVQGQYYPDSVTVTFTKAFDYIKSRDPIAAELLIASAFLSADLIPEYLFVENKYQELWGDSLSELAGKKIPFNKSFQKILNLSLMKRSPLGDIRVLNIHRVVQEVFRFMVKRDEQKWQKKVIKVLDRAFPSQVEDQDQWSQCDQLLPHVFQAQQWIHELNIPEEESSLEIAEQAAYLLFKAGYYLYVRSDYQKAEELLQESHQIIDHLIEIEEGQEKRDLQIKLSDIKHQLAKTYKKFSKNRKAEQYFKECLKLRESILGEQDAKVANVLYNMAEFYRLQGKNKKAFQKYRSALTIRQNLLEQAEDEKSDSSQEEIIEKKLHLASTYNGIGSFCIGRNDFKKAEKFVKRSLEIRQSLMDSAEEEQEGKYARYVYRCLNNLGIILGEQEKYPEAEKYLKKAIYYLEEKVFKGKKHSHIGTSSSNLGTVYKLQGEIALQQKKQEEAEKLFNKAYESYDKALDQRISTLGPDNPITGRAYMLLAYVCKLLNTEEKAKKAKIYENEVNRIKQKNSDKEGIDKYFKDKFDTY